MQCSSSPFLRPVVVCGVMTVFSPLARAQDLFAVPEQPAAVRPAFDENGFIPLFSGKDLTGWTPKIHGYAAGVNFGDTFRVEDGVLKVSYENYEEFEGRFGHLFHEAEWSSYALRLDYREPQLDERDGDARVII